MACNEINLSDYDFTALDMIMPQAKHASYHFICVLSHQKKTAQKR